MQTNLITSMPHLLVKSRVKLLDFLFHISKSDRVFYVYEYISARRELMPEINRYQAFIHSDFKPANMLVTNDDKVYIVDWEYACTGHLIADIGQFFRYRQHFSVSDFELFESVYNEYANIRKRFHTNKLSGVIQ